MTSDDDPNYRLVFSYDDGGLLNLLVFGTDDPGVPVEFCSVGADLDGEGLKQAAADLLDGEPWPDDAPMQTGHRQEHDEYDDLIVTDPEAVDHDGNEKPEKSAHEAVQDLRDSLRRARANNLNTEEPRDSDVQLTYKEEYGYSARHLDEGVASQGESEEEALRALAEALDLHRRDDGDGFETPPMDDFLDENQTADEVDKTGDE